MGTTGAVKGFIRMIDEMKPGIVTPFLRALAQLEYAEWLVGGRRSEEAASR